MRTQLNAGLFFPIIEKIDRQGIKEVYSKAITDFLTKHYKWGLVALITMIVCLESIEHFTPYESSKVVYLAELSLNVFLLITTGYLTSRLLIAISERSRAFHILQLKHDLGMRLSASQDINEVASQLVKQTVLILPLVAVELYLYEKNKNRFIHTANINLDESTPDKKEKYYSCGLDPGLCAHCMVRSGGRLTPLDTCNQKECFILNQQPGGYCLSLIQGNEPVGLLFLSTASQKNLTVEQIELLEYLSAEMSSSLSLAVQRKERDDERLNQSMHTFQLDIARDLHDTIGQNISYLRMKLEKLAEANQLARTDEDKDINHMYEVVNESYDLIRGMLSVLQSTKSISLQQLFTRYADQVTERSMIEISFSSHGIPKTLTPRETRHLFYIFREALSNIEKYAHAGQVSVELDWHEENLDLVISDDGCGFDPAQISLRNHYGLTFMRDRAQYLKGTFSILSKINQGTEITVQVPCV